MPPTDPAIRAEERRWPRKQIKTVLTDGGRQLQREIIRLFCLPLNERKRGGFERERRESGCSLM